MNHVPYKGGGPALTDTIAGQTDLYFSSIPTVLPHVNSRRLHAVAVTTIQRFPTVQDIPTVAESGLPGYELVLRVRPGRSQGTAAPNRGSHQQRSDNDLEIE